MKKDAASLSKLLDRMEREEREILKLKGADYSDSSGHNRLANFERLAARLGLSDLQIWAVYAMKHIDAILTYCADGRVQSEAIEGRITDARNYLALLRLMIEVKRPSVNPAAYIPTTLPEFQPFNMSSSSITAAKLFDGDPREREE